jgi:hypothetical protein
VNVNKTTGNPNSPKKRFSPVELRRDSANSAELTQYVDTSGKYIHLFSELPSPFLSHEKELATAFHQTRGENPY